MFLIWRRTQQNQQNLFSVDYPYSDNRACKRFLENLPISPDDREKVAHLNAERLLKFNPWRQ
jgi:predicted TIM-barrel fold metal-dependent hydrolase